MLEMVIENSLILKHIEIATIVIQFVFYKFKIIFLYA